MHAVQEMTLPYVVLIFGGIAVILVMLACCAVAWIVVNRICARYEPGPPVIYGSYEQDAELRSKFGRHEESC